MFEWLAEFDKILVTGPQRSGTRICTKMIAYDTGHEYVDELGIIGDSINWLGALVHTKQRCVVQCPALCRHIHMFSTDDTAIVLMRRRIEDILASQERVDWRGEWLELARYDRQDGVIAEIKYQFWDQVQKEQIQHSFEVEYEHLAEHPLWVAKPLRQGFRIGQTAILDADLPESARLQPYSDVLYEDDLDQIEAVVSKRGPTKLLNVIGRMIWQLCDGTRSRQDILRALKAQFADVEEEALARDLDEFLAELIRLRFLWLSADTIEAESGRETSGGSRC